ncbi:DUF1015 domain-containing protein [Chloroflexota bacterium]
MAEIRPFRGVRYNESLIKDWPAVICPPYDIITPQLQQELYISSDYNFVRLEFSRELPQDTVTDNKYTRSAATLKEWLKQGILEIDEKPAIYLHDQSFTHQGREYKRRSIFTRVRVEEWDKMVIRPHEDTLAEPRSDRLNLLLTLEANTSSILALFEDRGRQISSLLAEQERGKPIICLRSVNGESHDVWAISDPEVVNQIASTLAGQPLYIADGHHRYESALAYQRQRRDSSPSASGDEAFNFVMMTLVEFYDPGLIVLPPHRLVRGISKPTLNQLMPKLKVFFELEELPLSMHDVWKQVDELLTQTNEIKLILFGLVAGCLSVLKLRDTTAISQMIPHFHSELYKRLDVSIIDHIIIEGLLALSNDKKQSSLAYSYDRLDAVNRVLVQEYQLAFLLGPVKTEVIKAIADVGDRLPKKSTYFYPKVPAGLVFHCLH